MMPPSVLQALSLSARAVGRSLWLAPVGFLLSFLGRAATAPATLFLGAVLARGFAAGTASGDGVAAGAAAALAAVTSPRAVLIWLGLWLGGLLLRGACRVLWLSGALPVLGEALSGREGPAFATGVAWGYPRVLATALLGFLAEAAATGSALGAVAGAVAVSSRLAGRGQGGAALLVALALTAAVAVPLAAGLVADAALSRAALRGEAPAAAFTGALLRLGRRPSAFAAVALGVGLGVVVLGGSAELVAGTGLQVIASRVHPALLLVPELAGAVFGAMAAALLELWRLGAVATLACHQVPTDLQG